MWSRQNDDTMGGGGGFMAGESGGSGAPHAADSESKSTQLVSVTAAQIMKLIKPEGGLVLWQQPVSHIKYIGLVREVKDHNLKSEYRLLDVNSDKEILVDMIKGQDTEHSLFNQTPNIMENTYVRVIGKPKHKTNPDTSEQTPYILAFNVDPVKDINEVYSFVLETIRDSMLFEKLSKMNLIDENSRSNMSTAGYTAPSGDFESKPFVGASGSGGTGAAGPGGFSRNQNIIMQILSKCDAEEGMSLDAVCAAMKGSQPDDIRQTLTFLTEEGHVYNTIDDEHYKATK